MNKAVSPQGRRCAFIVLSIWLLSSAVAGVRLSNTIDPAVSLSDRGRHLVVTGPITCPVDDRVRIRVTVSQRSTGAVAEGSAHVVCTGDKQQWIADLQTHGKEPFAPGPAVAVALGQTTNPLSSPDAHQWMVAVDLRY
jgi:hypothetical protein